MSASSTTSELPSPDVMLGPILIGGAVTFFLYGLTCLQTFIYQDRYPRDRRSTKLAVLILWLIDTLDVALVTQTCYYYMVTNIGNEIAILSPTWSLKLHVLVTSLTDFVVRTMFTKRIYALSHRNLPIALVIAALSLLDLAIGIVITARAWKIDTYEGLSAVSTLFDVNFATILIADTCVAICLTYFLWINRTGSEKADSLVNKLVLYAVTTGFLTIIDATLGVITYHTNPTTLIFIAFYFNLSKLYVNSYLASLNIRKSLLRPLHTDTAVSIQLTGVTTGARMPSFRHPETMDEGGMEVVSKVMTGNTFDSDEGKRIGLGLSESESGMETNEKKNGGSGSSITSTTVVETPTTATQRVGHMFRHHESDDEMQVIQDGGKAELNKDDVEAAALEVGGMDFDAYDGEVDPEVAYTQQS